MHPELILLWPWWYMCISILSDCVSLPNPSCRKCQIQNFSVLSCRTPAGILFNWIHPELCIFCNSCLENFGYFIFWWKILFYTLWNLIFHAVHLNFVMWTKLLMINTNSNHISCFHCEFMTWLFLSVKFVFSFWYSGILHCRCFPFMTFPLYTESPYCWRSKACQSTWWRGSTWTTPPPTTTGGCCAGKISPAGKPEIVKLQRI